MNRTSLFAIALALAGAPALSQETPAGDAPSKEAKAEAEKPNPDQVKASVEEDEQPVKRSISLRGRSLSYTVTPGHLTIRNDKGEPTASMFYVAYTVPSRGSRPVTFLFNGGPGSSTMWLHMGSFAPVKVDASIPETVAGPPFRYGPNPDTLLDVTDLVFIDAPTTGLSREIGKAEPKDFFGVDKDIDAFSRTIQRYLTKYGRWNSPKFLIGESYGTTRAAGLSDALLNQGVQLNGIAFVSTVFNFADFQGDQSFVNFFPTLAANAWYHGKIEAKGDLRQFLAEASAFAAGPLSARPPTIPLTATTGTPRVLAAASAPVTPGTARMGAIDTSGFDGAITIASARSRASSTSSVGAAPSIPSNLISRTSGTWRRRTK